MNKPLEEMGRFSTVVIDPPWSLNPIGLVREGKTNYDALSYKTMSVEEIKALPIKSVCAEDSIIFCWTINKYLPYTFSVIESWGCKYSFTMTWVKNGGIQTPVTPQFNSEWIVVGRFGKLKFKETKAFFTANFWARSGHSEKPEGFYDLLRRVTPSPRIDIFGRRLIPGFVSWGDEAPEGEDLNFNYQDVFDLN